MELKALIAECTAYDFKVMLEEKVCPDGDKAPFLYFKERYIPNHV